MSIEIVLIPLAIATVASWQARKAAAMTTEDGAVVCHVSTRMKDASLLQTALGDTGANTTFDGATLAATWPHAEARFSRDDSGVWTAHVSGNVDEEDAASLIHTLDAAYGKRVQQLLLERLRTGASQVGLELQSETQQEDDSVVMVLKVTA